MPTTLSILFADRAAETPNAPALWVAGRTVSYGELQELRARIAATLAADEARGERPRAAVLAYRTLGAYASVLGVLGSGSAYVPLHPRFPLPRTRRMLETANVHAVLVDERCEPIAAQLLPQAERSLLVLFPTHRELPAWTALHPQHRYLCAGELEPATAPPAPEPDALAYILFTSGSTGVPKAIAVTHRNVTSYLGNLARLLPLGASDRFTQLFDLTFDLSVHDMFVCWNAGACLYVADESTLMAPAKLVRDHELSVWFSVPSTAAFMARLGMLAAGAFPSLRFALFCGEALPATLAAQFRLAAPNARAFNLYGPTETTIAITAFEFTHVPLDPFRACVPIGWPLYEQSARILGGDGELAAAGEQGELYLAGSQVTPGYFGNHELTSKSFVSLPGEPEGRRFYRTGDLASEHPTYGLFFHGRADQQIKIRGFRVEVQEIEAVVRRAAGTEQVAVVGFPTSPTEGTLGTVAFLAGSSASPDLLLEACRTQLPDYMVPAQFRSLPALPLNANGKTDYGALKARLEAE